MRATNVKFYPYSNHKLNSLTIDSDNTAHNLSTNEYSTISAYTNQRNPKTIPRKGFLRTLSNPRNQWQPNERSTKQGEKRSKSVARKNQRFASIYAKPFKQRIKVNNDYINIHQKNASFKNNTDYIKAINNVQRNEKLNSRNESPSYPHIKMDPHTISINVCFYY